MTIEAYLFFPGNAEEAINFYKTVFGGELSVTRVGDVNPGAPEAEKAQVINAHLAGGDFNLRASDRSDTSLEPQTRVDLSIIGTDEAKLRKIFDDLSVGGTVRTPLEKQFWGDTFGGLVDTFGINWQVNISAVKS
jgi:PhnB protein